MSVESPEQLLDAFKAAALSVTKLYKTSAAAQAKSRTDGYQDCLEDLLSFLDRESIGVNDGEGKRIRKWVAERLEGRDSASQNTESEDEADKTEAASLPEMHPPANTAQLPTTRDEFNMRDSSQMATQAVAPVTEEPEIVVPTQETFTFQSQHPYPHETYLNLASLDLSDSHGNTPNPPMSRSSRARHGSGARPGSRPANHLGRGAGQKRKLNIAEIFDLGSLSKDPFANGGKRSRHA